MNEHDDSISVSAAGRLGGKKLLETHGLEHFRALGKLGGQTVARQRGREFYRQIGRKAARP